METPNTVPTGDVPIALISHSRSRKAVCGLQVSSKFHIDIWTFQSPCLATTNWFIGYVFGLLSCSSSWNLYLFSLHPSYSKLGPHSCSLNLHVLSADSPTKLQSQTRLYQFTNKTLPTPMFSFLFLNHLPSWLSAFSLVTIAPHGNEPEFPLASIDVTWVDAKRLHISTWNLHKTAIKLT